MKARRLSFTSPRKRLFLLRCVLTFLLLSILHTVLHAGSNVIFSTTTTFRHFGLLAIPSSLHANPSLTSSRSAMPNPHGAGPTHISWSTHPITRLMSLAEDRFRTKLDRQSKTFEAAVVEYQRRYSMPPPKGFDKWWDFMQQYDVVMIDEYDGMMRDLQPFYNVQGGGKEIRRRIAAVASLPSIDLVRVRGGVASTLSIQAEGYVDTEVSARAKGLKSMLGKFMQELPDMDFPVNAKAEGRVIVPWEKRQEQYNSTNDNITHYINSLTSFKPDWKGEGNVWDAWRRTCPPNSRARKLFSSIRSGMHTIDIPSMHPTLSAYRELNDPSDPYDPYHPFNLANPHTQSIRLTTRTQNEAASSLSSASLSSLTSPQFTFSPNTPYHDQSFCDEPHLHYMQGHFFSDWRTIGELYPVMSPARASGFADIKIPSHYYYGSTSRYTYGWDAEKGQLRDVDKDEVPWGIRQNDTNPTSEVDDEDGDESAPTQSHKLDKIFWRGATTGGGNEPAGFAGMYQRHRAVRNLGGWGRKGEGDVWVPATTNSRTTSSILHLPSPSSLFFLSPFLSFLRFLLAKFDLNLDIHLRATWVTDSLASSPLQRTSVDLGEVSTANFVDGYGGLRYLSIPYSTLNKEIMDIAFMKATNPAQYPGGLEKLMQDHRFAEGIPLGGHWKYKYLLDLDGMSYSGRFMAFLASDSVPVKSTVYEEFFGEWIEPWLHYIPLSAGYEEIYNIYAYFSGIPGEVVEQVDDPSGRNGTPTRSVKYIPGAPDGDARLHRIALAGKQWKRTIGRTIDMEAYVYRLALEWARLCSDDREAMSMFTRS